MHSQLNHIAAKQHIADLHRRAADQRAAQDAAEARTPSAAPRRRIARLGSLLRRHDAEPMSDASRLETVA
jgi:hypothetical protein